MDAAQWDARYRDEPLVWSREPNVFVATHLAALPPGRALDLAGGEGRNAIWLAQRGWDVELVDFSPVALSKARTLAEQVGVTVTTTLADIAAAPQLAPAGLVVMAYLQLSPTERKAALQYACGLVAAGGTLFVVGHARRNLTEGVGGPSDPALLYEVNEAVNVATSCGLTVEVASEVVRPVDTDEGTRNAIDIVLRASRP